MSRLRELLQATKEEDPARNITVSIPSSLATWIDKIMLDTALGRSTVVKALLQDGLIEYLNAPLRDERRKYAALCDDHEFDGYIETSEVEHLGFDVQFEPVIDVNRVFEAIDARMEHNKKVVMG